MLHGKDPRYACLQLQTSTRDGSDNWNLGGLEVENLHNGENDHHSDQKDHQSLENLVQIVLWKGSGSDGSDQWHDSLIHTNTGNVESGLCQQETDGGTGNLLLLDEGLKIHNEFVFENE